MSVLSRIISTDAARAHRSDKGLKEGALGLLSSTVVGVASTAPAYSLASALGFVGIVLVLLFRPGPHPDALHLLGVGHVRFRE